MNLTVRCQKKTNKYININLKNIVIIVPLLLLTIRLNTRDKLISEICSESLVQSVFMAVIDVFQHERHSQIGRRRNGMILEQKAKIFCLLIYSDMSSEMEFELFLLVLCKSNNHEREMQRLYISRFNKVVDGDDERDGDKSSAVTRRPTRQHKQTFPT